jgi:hypothetical protein
MKIAIIGSSRIGGLVGKLWTEAGHQVRFSSRHPDDLDALVADSGPNASRSSIEDALPFGDVIIISIPYGSLPAFGVQYGSQLVRKIVIETGNPYPERDAMWPGWCSTPVSAPVIGPRIGCRAPSWSARSIPFGTRLLRAKLIELRHRLECRWRRMTRTRRILSLAWFATLGLTRCWLDRCRVPVSST